MKLAELVRATAGLDAGAFIQQYPHPALVFLRGGPLGVGSPSEEADTDETGELKTTTRVHVLRGKAVEPPRDDGAPSSESEVVFLVKRTTWAPLEDVITVGRASIQDVSLPLASVSKFHACLTRLPQGWRVTDERSANGTFVDDRQLAPGGSQLLREGALVAFGPEVRARFFTPAGLHALTRERR